MLYILVFMLITMVLMPTEVLKCVLVSVLFGFIKFPISYQSDLAFEFHLLSRFSKNKVLAL